MKYRNFIINVCLTFLALLLFMASFIVALQIAGAFVYASI